MTINTPDGYSVKVNDTRVANVTLIGPEDELEELSPSSVVATVDMSQSQVVEGTESLSASISYPSSTIFAVGSYSVECSITVDSGADQKKMLLIRGLRAGSTPALSPNSRPKPWPAKSWRGRKSGGQRGAGQLSVSMPGTASPCWCIPSPSP